MNAQSVIWLAPLSFTKMTWDQLNEAEQESLDDTCIGFIISAVDLYTTKSILYHWSLVTEKYNKTKW